MALVAYSDSEDSDAELKATSTPTPSTEKSKKPDPGADFHIDRSNPRKIRVALPELKPEYPANQDTEDEPARKKARMGGVSGGAFSGFNALLPAPKRAAEKKAPVASTRKVFSLKTGATPGFDRNADAEMKNDQALRNAGDNDTSMDDDTPAARSLGSTATTTTTTTMSDTAALQKFNLGEVKLQGNPMMFRPLSVARTQKKKKTTKPTTQSMPAASVTSQFKSAEAKSQPNQNASTTGPASPPSKPKVSLFSISLEDSAGRAEHTSASAGAYEPLVYNIESEAAFNEPVPPPDFTPTAAHFPSNATVSSSLNNIADDLNLSRSERRQLFGRNAPSAESRILTFNTDKEYASNQALAQSELAAAQHNPIRPLAAPGGRHSLQQLVNAATSQKEALEESFAAGRRNKKEAGSKYGW